jgi:hypothetical protein
MKLGKLLNQPEAARYFVPDARFVLPDCRIGVEFEFEHTGIIAERRQLPVTPWSHYWQWHEEGSIRDAGSEFVFVEPLFGRDAITAIEGLCGMARELRWRSTLRTGLHVHLDVRDMEVPQLIGFGVLYAILEPAIYHWIGDNRENSHFCIPWYKAEGSLLEAAQIFQAALKPSEGPNGELLNSSERYNRYAGMNWQSLYKFGSVEARHMKTTTDPVRVLRWINLLMAIKRATTRIPHSDTAIVREVEHLGPREAIYRFLGPDFGWFQYPELERDVLEKGIPTANELIRQGLTVNLWDVLTNPRGINAGFAKFAAARQGAARFEEPENREVPQDDPDEDAFRIDEDAPMAQALWRIEPPLEAGQVPQRVADPAPGAALVRARRALEQQAQQLRNDARRNPLFGRPNNRGNR